MKKTKKIVQFLFKKRTGIDYQNWIQAWGVTLQDKKEIKKENLSTQEDGVKR
tara:strand:+ start:1300 stop:1455 length:156 start_codon:yes stop_codon:yes gene_type:complete